MNKQRGAVLIIALIFLLLITAIATSLMTSSSFETVMVANRQIRKDDFHAAEAGNEDLMRQSTAVFNAGKQGAGVVDATAFVTALPAESGMVRTATVEFLNGVGMPVEGQSLEGGGSTYELYELGTTVTAANSQTRHVIGVAKNPGLPQQNYYGP